MDRNSKMYIKICGLQTVETVAAAVEAGANAVGFIFAPGSPRTVTAALAATLVSSVPEGIETVGVFRDQPLDEVLATSREAQLTTIQLHGAEPLADVKRLHAAGFRTLRAFSVAAYNALNSEDKRAWESERILLDAVEPGAGETFDSSELTHGAPQGFWLLAGGLNPTNVATLAQALQPHGVDVSSGVESSRGVKDSTLIRDFIQAARGIS